MKIRRLALVVALAISWSTIAVAQGLVAASNPEQLSFSPARLQRMTQAYQGYVETTCPSSRASR